MGIGRKEFSTYVKQQAFKRANYECQHPGCHETKGLEVHHILALWFAAEYFPQLATHVLTSLENACVLCRKHHIVWHNEDSTAKNREFYKQKGERLSRRQKRLF